MTKRKQLLNRRSSETFEFRWRGMTYTAIGRFPDGKLAEIFLNGGKLSTDSDAIARDAGVVASMPRRACRSDQRPTILRP